MADRKATITEKPGTFIQHYTTGETGIIQRQNIDSYYIKWFGKRNGFLPYNKVDEYVVIE